jgi:hypothetical protein
MLKFLLIALQFIIIIYCVFKKKDNDILLSSYAANIMMNIVQLFKLFNYLCLTYAFVFGESKIIQ